MGVGARGQLKNCHIQKKIEKLLLSTKHANEFNWKFDGNFKRMQMSMWNHYFFLLFNPTIMKNLRKFLKLAYGWQVRVVGWGRGKCPSPFPRWLLLWFATKYKMKIQSCNNNIKYCFVLRGWVFRALRNQILIANLKFWFSILQTPYLEMYYQVSANW